jgi:hypothetical protein
MKRIFSLILMFSSFCPDHAQAGNDLNLTVCVASIHRDPSGKDQTNPGAGLEYFASMPDYRIGPLTPYFAGGGAYCKDSNYQTPDGHRYDSELPNRAYLHADAGLEFKPMEALNMGVAIRLGAANYRAVGELMDLPHAGDFAIAPVPDFRFSLEPQAMGIEKKETLAFVLDHLSLDVTWAIDPAENKGGFVAFVFNWSVPLSRPGD